jgi:hypothetical protein
LKDLDKAISKTCQSAMWILVKTNNNEKAELKHNMCKGSIILFGEFKNCLCICHDKYESAKSKMIRCGYKETSSTNKNGI